MTVAADGGPLPLPLSLAPLRLLPACASPASLFERPGRGGEKSAGESETEVVTATRAPERGDSCGDSDTEIGRSRARCSGMAGFVGCVGAVPAAPVSAELRSVATAVATTLCAAGPPRKPRWPRSTVGVSSRWISPCLR